MTTKQIGTVGGLERGLVMRAELGPDGLVRGTASTYGNADRMDRVLLPGAFGRVGSQLQVPFLLNHKDDVPLGQSTFTVTRDGLTHETDIVGDPAQPGTGVPIRDLLRKGYPATSIGWLPKRAYFGWRNFAKAEPEAARQAAAMGVAQSDQARYFSEVEVVENSLVPIPANPRALLEAASLLSPRSSERAELEAIVELAAGARHSTSDQSAIQRAHDALAEAGATCTQPLDPGETMDADDTGPGPMPPSDSGVKGGWQKHMHSSYHDVALRVLQEHEVPDSDALAARIGLDLEVAAKYSADQLRTMLKQGEAMANANGDPSYPIGDAEDLGNAIRAVGRGGADSDAIRRYVIKRARALKLTDQIPDTWSADGSLKQASAITLPEDGYQERNGKRVFDPDNDGDDDSSPEGDTDHSHWDKNGKPTPLGLETFGQKFAAEFVELHAEFMAALGAGEREIADLL